MSEELVLSVKVKTNARRSIFEPSEGEDGIWKAELKSLPIDGKANKELIGLIAKHFKVAKSKVDIKHGASGKLKRVIVQA